jgi:glucose dehydrogenase
MASLLLTLLFSSLIFSDDSQVLNPHLMWRDYAGAEDSSQYSAITQINRSNVSKLEVAWIYPTGDTNKYFFNPIEVDGLVYVLAKNNSIVALDASTGKEVWLHQTDPATKLITNRGINYWESKDRSERRLLFACNNLLQAVDARTGKSILLERNGVERNGDGRTYGGKEWGWKGMEGIIRNGDGRTYSPRSYHPTEGQRGNILGRHYSSDSAADSQTV